LTQLKAFGSNCSDAAPWHHSSSAARTLAFTVQDWVADDGSFWDANGQSIAFVYGRATEAEAMQAKVLTMDEARRIARNIARLPELLGKGVRG
jgi:hypothetical protein